MDEARAAKVRATVYIVTGLLWLSLTGTCTWDVSRGGEFGSMWPMGLMFMSPGVAPLALGLRSFAPPRVLGAALIGLGAAWIAFGVKLFIPALLQPGVLSNPGLILLVFFWAIFQAPGAAMGWSGLKIFRTKA